MTALTPSILPHQRLQPRDLDQHPRPVDQDRLAAFAMDGIDVHQRCEPVIRSSITAGALD